MLTREIGDFLQSPVPLIIAKSTLPSRVHRRVQCDYIGVKKYDAEGRVNGEVRFLGLFTAEAYDETARSIPFVRRRVQKIMAASARRRVATPKGPRQPHRNLAARRAAPDPLDGSGPDDHGRAASHRPPAHPRLPAPR